uniref:Uncharacterized protein n=1 Tax=Anguilla anguilla TaxID=7936 RepID=A0A0E9SLY5_ANGAN
MDGCVKRRKRRMCRCEKKTQR